MRPDEPITIALSGAGDGTPAKALAAALVSAGFVIAGDNSGEATLLVDARLLHGGFSADWVAICAAPRPGTNVVLLPAAADRLQRQAVGARIRALALVLAPERRLNAIGVGPELVGLDTALRLITAAPSMTGQVLWLAAQPHAGVAIAALAQPAVPAALLPAARSWPGLRRVFVRDLVLACRIGVYRHEREGAQRVRINLDLGVDDDPTTAERDRLSDVVCYDRLAGGVRRVVSAGHVALVETLAERIAEVCLADARVAVARVRIEKLDVFADAVSAGVEIERRRPIS